MERRILLMAIAFVIALTFNVYAQPSDKDHPYKAMFDELRNNVQTYTQTDIIPVMKEWKLKLDNSMETADLQKLNDLRTKAIDERNKIKNELKENKTENKDNKKELKEERKDDMKEARSEFKDLATDLKPLAVKYKSVLKSIGENAKPKVEEWKSKIEGIFTTWKDKYKDQLEKLKTQAEAHGKTMDMEKRFEKMHDFKADFSKKIVFARFMLWDGNGNFLWENSNKPPNPNKNNN